MIYSWFGMLPARKKVGADCFFVTALCQCQSMFKTRERAGHRRLAGTDPTGEPNHDHRPRAYALTRAVLPGRWLFQGISLIPIFAPSLLPGIALIYLFGNQGFLKGVLGGPIYGFDGIVIAQVFYCFPHATLILATALATADARLYEAAEVLGASRLRTFFTVTLPGASFGWARRCAIAPRRSLAASAMFSAMSIFPA